MQNELNVNKTTFEAWSDTTFILCNPEAPEPVPPAEDLKKISSLIQTSELRLTVSPEMQQTTKALPVEAEPTAELDPNQKFIESVAADLSEILGLPEKTPIPARVIQALSADTQRSVELDLKLTPGSQISPEARTYSAAN